MLTRRAGITLIEIIIVLVIVGIAAAFVFPNFTLPTEQARAGSVQNNLLAIYSAQQNYKNNYGVYCTSLVGIGNNAAPPDCGDNLPDLNTGLSLSFNDDGTYAYTCTVGPPPICTATRVGTPTTNLVLTLNVATNLSGVGVANPVCNTANNWCPYSP